MQSVRLNANNNEKKIIILSLKPVVQRCVSVKERFRARIKFPCDAVSGKVKGTGGLSHVFKDPAMQNNSPAFAALDTL